MLILNTMMRTMNRTLKWFTKLQGKVISQLTGKYMNLKRARMFLTEIQDLGNHFSSLMLLPKPGFDGRLIFILSQLWLFSIYSALLIDLISVSFAIWDMT